MIIKNVDQYGNATIVHTKDRSLNIKILTGTSTKAPCVSAYTLAGNQILVQDITGHVEVHDDLGNVIHHATAEELHPSA